MHFTVGTADFRHALMTVLPHAADDEEKRPQLSRIRLAVERDYVEVMATDGFTMAMAVASVWEHADASAPVLGSFDIAPSTATKILSLFKVGKEDEDSDAPAFVLDLDVDDPEFLTVTDTSGLLPGQRLRVPRPPLEEIFPDVPQFLSDLTASDWTPIVESSMGGKLLARFVKAATVYGPGLQLAAHDGTSSLSVRCGESFIGALSPMKPNEEQLARWKEWRAGWEARMPAPRPRRERFRTAATS